MQLRNFSLLLLLASSFLQTLNGYVYGYKRLCHSKLGKTIDLLYDAHVAVPHISIEQFLQFDCVTAASKLYATEQKVFSVLKELDKKGSCDLIWESSTTGRFKSIPRTPCFIALDSFFGLHRFQNIRFIAADKNRNCGFNSLFSIKERGAVRPAYNLTGCTFDNPVPLPTATIEAIKRVSGDYVWQQYAVFRDRLLERLKNYFAKAYRYRYTLDYKKDIYENDAFHSLCDIEMLAHILTSDASRIIVYAGGWHCANIAQFLETSAGFKVVNYEDNSLRQELPVRLLDPLDTDNKVVSPASLLPSLYFSLPCCGFWECIVKKKDSVSS